MMWLFGAVAIVAWSCCIAAARADEKCARMQTEPMRRVWKGVDADTEALRSGYQDGIRDGIVCGLAMSAVVALQEKPDDSGDALAAALLRIAGVEDIEGLAALRNNPVDEHNVDYLVCHFGNLGATRFSDLADETPG